MKKGLTLEQKLKLILGVLQEFEKRGREDYICETLKEVARTTGDSGIIDFVQEYFETTDSEEYRVTDLALWLIPELAWIKPEEIDNFGDFGWFGIPCRGKGVRTLKLLKLGLKLLANG
jgi:hypothetical protein